jgi:S-formylglutathione hydrolase FrmB
MYSSSATTGDWETFVAEGLVNYVDEHYRTIPERASRGLAGHSMGGYGTVRIGMKHPEVFSSIYAMSPCCMRAGLEPDTSALKQAARIDSLNQIADAGFFTKAMLASAAAWSPAPKEPPLYVDLPWEDGEIQSDVVAEQAANAILAMVHQYVPELRRLNAIALDAGAQDQPIAGSTEKLAGILAEYGIDHTVEIYDPGDHVSRVDERVEGSVLPFFSEQLAQ